MIEQKLQIAANSLPEPRGDFLSVEEAAKKIQVRKKVNRRKRFAVAMVLVLLLVGCVAVTEPDYHLYNGNWQGFFSGMDITGELPGWAWNETRRAADKLSITLPETLGGYPVIEFSRYNLTNQDVPIWRAWLSPRYVYQSGYYGVEMEEPYISPDGISGTRHWREGVKLIYGSTHDEIWRRQFGYDEQDAYVAGTHTRLNHDYGEITSLEYEGQTIYVGWIQYENLEHPYWEVTWVDQDHGVVFALEGNAESPDALIEYAKEIIDLNK